MAVAEVVEKVVEEVVEGHPLFPSLPASRQQSPGIKKKWDQTGRTIMMSR